MTVDLHRYLASSQRGSIAHGAQHLELGIEKLPDFLPALRSYCEEFGALSGIQIALEIQGSFDGVAPAAALCLLRVAHEALRNVAKHARVTEASVELRRAGGVLQLTVSDRGVGMDRDRAGAKAGLGLLNIQERARLVGGKVKVLSTPGEGTSIAAEVPE